MVWHSCFFQNFPQFVMIHTVKGFNVVNEAEVEVEEEVLLEIYCFLMTQRM